MMRIWHQLLAVTIFTGSVWAGHRYGTAPASAEILKTAAAIPFGALGVMLWATLLPDGDGNGSVTNNPILAPFFWVLRWFVSHRGFTHALEWIAAFWFLFLLLGKYAPQTLWAAYLIAFLFLTIIWVVMDSGPVRASMAVMTLVTAPMLMLPSYWSALMLGCFVAYVAHMPADAITSEGWTLTRILPKGFRPKIAFPFAFRAGGTIENYVVYPALLLAILYFFGSEFAFWQTKFVQELSMLANAYSGLAKSIVTII